ncbi:hypothetical protein H6G35_30645 [Aulosira sp. FACHB-113]|uniref:hypothetical protein n=1 Tax=Tolypothrix tenuis TaxID=457083 RepID=UPI001682FA53|nr:hypothetical protein [Aulosira sp. FACHB-113]
MFSSLIYDNDRRNSVFRAFIYSDRPRLSAFYPSIWADRCLKNSLAHRRHGKNENAIAHTCSQIKLNGYRTNI